MARLQVEALRYAYQPGGAEVLRGIDLTIAPGEFLALIGQNGAGKSTLAKHFNGVHRATGGRVLLDGQDVARFEIAHLAQTVGYCYQNPDHQIFHTSIWDEVAFGPTNIGLDPADVETRVRESLKAVGLWDIRGEAPFFAGKGERQRIAVASVLAMRPAVLVLDEPTTGLDWKGAREIMALVQRLNEAGRTVVVITHDMWLVAEYAHRVVVLGNGQVLADGNPAEIFAQPDLLARTSLQPPQITRLALALRPDLPPALTVAALAAELDVTPRSTSQAVSEAFNAINPELVRAAGTEALAAAPRVAPAVGGGQAEAAAVPQPQLGSQRQPLPGMQPSARFLLAAGLTLLPMVFQSPLLLLLDVGLTALFARYLGMPKGGWRAWYVLGVVGGFITFLTWLPFQDGGTTLLQIPLGFATLTITTLSVTWGLVTALRIAAAALAALAFIGSTPPRQITMALRGLGLPFPPAYLISLAFRLLPVSQHDGAMIREAQAVRGLDFKSGSALARAKRYTAILGPLILLALRRVPLIANSLDARGFRMRGGQHRSYRLPRWSRLDVGLVVGLVLLLAVSLWLRSQGVGVVIPGRI